MVEQIYKAIKLAFYNIINRNQRLWLSPRHHWFSNFARQLRTLCRVKFLADSACRYCDSWREHALSGMSRPLVTYDDGGSALCIKWLNFRKLSNVTCCTESRFALRASILLTPQKLQKLIVLLQKISCELVTFPGNDIPKFPSFSWPGSLINVCSKKTCHWFKYFALM